MTRARSLGIVPGDIDIRLPDSQPSAAGQALIGVAPTNPSDPVQLQWGAAGGGGGGTGTVTSVGLAAPSQFTVTGSPVTTVGNLTLSWAAQAPNLFLAGPATGTTGAAPIFRGLSPNDLPRLNNIVLNGATTGAVTVAAPSTGASWQLTLPAAVGTAGQVLTTDAAGVTSWTTPGTISDGDKGDITVSGTGATWTIDANAVTYAKMQTVAGAQRVLGSATAGGAVSEINASAILDWVVGAVAQGAVLFRGAVQWQLLPPGTAGQFLQTGGAGADPHWATATGGGTTSTNYMTWGGTGFELTWG